MPPNTQTMNTRPIRFLQLRPVNACIQFLPTLDGKALFTVEDVAAADGTLHPVQRAMVDCRELMRVPAPPAPPPTVRTSRRCRLARRSFPASPA